MRFDPDVTGGQELADGITGLGYPTRHLSSTVLSGDGGDGDAKGGAAAVTLEVLGVAGPEGIASVSVEGERGRGRRACRLL